MQILEQRCYDEYTEVECKQKPEFVTLGDEPHPFDAAALVSIISQITQVLGCSLRRLSSLPAQVLRRLDLASGSYSIAALRVTAEEDPLY